MIVLGVVVFVVGKLLKWWAILRSGRFWTFRVIVVPGSTPVSDGPYRYLQASQLRWSRRRTRWVVALLAGAPVAGALGTALFAGVMAVRLKIETRWLRKVLG